MKDNVHLCSGEEPIEILGDGNAQILSGTHNFTQIPADFGRVNIHSPDQLYIRPLER